MTSKKLIFNLVDLFIKSTKQKNMIDNLYFYLFHNYFHLLNFDTRD